MLLDASLLNTQQYKVKWSNPGKGEAPSPTTRCSSFWKGSFLVALNYGRQLYFILITYPSNSSEKYLIFRRHGGRDKFLKILIHVLKKPAEKIFKVYFHS